MSVAVALGGCASLPPMAARSASYALPADDAAPLSHIVATSLAIANAVHNATGVRVRDFPISLDKLLSKMQEMDRDTRPRIQTVPLLHRRLSNAQRKLGKSVLEGSALDLCCMSPRHRQGDRLQVRRRALTIAAVAETQIAPRRCVQAHRSGADTTVRLTLRSA